MSSVDPAERVLLGERPGFLLSQLGHYAGDRFAERLQPLGLGPRHFGLLSHLETREGQSQQQLADAIGIHRNQMVGLVDELEARGLLERRRHPSDRRAHAVFLTAHAHELLSRAERTADEHDAELTAALDPDERRQLIGFLQRLADDAGLTADLHAALRAPGREGGDEP